MQALKTLALAGLLGAFALAGDASACHKKKCACPTTTVVACAPAPVVECAPAKKKCFSMPKMGCHKKATAVCAAPASYAPASYAPTATYASPQASAQASGQGM